MGLSRQCPWKTKKDEEWFLVFFALFGGKSACRRPSGLQEKSVHTAGKTPNRDSITSKVFEEEGEGVPGEGKGKLSSESFPFPSPDSFSLT